MNKVEIAYAIQRDDGKFYCGTRGNGKHLFNDRLIFSCTEIHKSEIEHRIKDYGLQNCSPVKIEIRTVEDVKN